MDINEEIIRNENFNWTLSPQAFQNNACCKYN